MNNMNISFTGIRNTSYAVDRNNWTKKVEARYLNTQLTDDKYGNDLTEYKALISKNKYFQNPFYSNFINIAAYNNYGTHVFQLNGKTIPETDEYIPLFSFVAKLTKKISEIPEKDYINDIGYLKSDFADKALLLDKSLSKELGIPLDDFFDKMHDPKNIKKCSKNINNSIQECMFSYFA